MLSLDAAAALPAFPTTFPLGAGRPTAYQLTQNLLFDACYYSVIASFLLFHTYFLLFQASSMVAFNFA